MAVYEAKVDGQRPPNFDGPAPLVSVVPPGALRDGHRFETAGPPARANRLDEFRGKSLSPGEVELAHAKLSASAT